MGLLGKQNMGVKIGVVFVFGTLAFALMQSAEFARQNYELTVCAAQKTGVDVCLLNSANIGPMIAQGSVAVASMAVAAAAANAFAPPTFGHMRTAFVSQHLIGVCVWYALTWAITLVPLIYTIYLLALQGNLSGSTLFILGPSSDNQSQLLLSLDGPPAYNPCNPNNVYCLSIVPGLLAGFGFLFAGATAFWTAWIVMDDTAHKILRGEDACVEVDGAYFSAVPKAEPELPQMEGTHPSGLR